MNEQRERKDRAWLLLLLLLPFGVLIMSVAGQIALSQPPTWRVRAAMDSALDPYLALTSESFGQISPVRGEIMTEPAWLSTLESSDGTPVSNPTQVGTQPSGGTATASPPATVTLVGSPTPIGTATTIPTETVVPTATIIYPPPTSTKPPPPDPTDTPIPTPVTDADLSISKNDGVTTYTPGESVTYTIVVSNAGPGDVTGATVSDSFPAQINNVNWTCVATGGASCTASGSGNINDTVDLPVGETLTYTANASIASSASGDMTNSAQVSPPTGVNDPDSSNNTATDPTDTSSASADLVLIKSGATNVYEPGDTLDYTITITNNGPSDAAGFDISDNLPAELTCLSVSCMATGTADCGTDASAGNSISFTGASLGAGIGNSLSLHISGKVAAGTVVNINNTATISIPGGASFSDPNGGNNLSTVTHERVYSPPYGNIGSTSDGATTNIGSGGSVILQITTQTGGDASWDLVYYELANGCGIAMDWVILQVGDGTNWYTIFNWGDGVVDGNTILASLGLPESDTRSICSVDLYGSTGVAIDLDAVVPPGSYDYIRILAPSGDGDGVVEVDAIEPLP